MKATSEPLPSQVICVQQMRTIAALRVRNKELEELLLIAQLEIDAGIKAYRALAQRGEHGLAYSRHFSVLLKIASIFSRQVRERV